VTLGIDAEPDLPLPDGVLEIVAMPSERTMLGMLGGRVHWDRLLFSAKEAVYKAWFPLMGCWLGFEDVLVSVDAVHGRFDARLPLLLHDGSGTLLESLHGRWGVRDGVIASVVELARVPG
jgi:4'-phosphopantetheinyl transferase EntD